MADVIFKKGTGNLPTASTEGTLYFDTSSGLVTLDLETSAVAKNSSRLVLNANNANTATKLGSYNKGSATNPIYLNAGAPSACTYSLNKTVPGDAVFTDTWVANAAGIAGYVAAPSVNTDINKVWKTDSSGVPAWRDDDNTIYTLPVASNNTLGGIQIGYSESNSGSSSNRNYAVKLNNNQAYVNVPWVWKQNTSSQDGYVLKPDYVFGNRFQYWSVDTYGNINWSVLPECNYESIDDNQGIVIQTGYYNISAQSDVLELASFNDSSTGVTPTKSYSIDWVKFVHDYKTSISIKLSSYYGTTYTGFNFNFSPILVNNQQVNSDFVSQDLTIKIPLLIYYWDQENSSEIYNFAIANCINTTQLKNFSYSIYTRTQEGIINVRLSEITSDYIIIKLSMIRSRTNIGTNWLGTIFLNFDFDTLV